jgi:hypothetical protein
VIADKLNAEGVRISRSTLDRHLGGCACPAGKIASKQTIPLSPLAPYACGVAA